MRSHKYFALPHRKQHVLGVSLCRLESTNATIPIVATTERGGITIGWWNPMAGQWRTYERPHQSLAISGADVTSATRWNWSQTVALTSVNNHAFLVYKRHLWGVGGRRTALWVEAFDYSADTGELTSALPPTEIPISQWGYHHAGFYVWAGIRNYPEPRLLVLVQGVRLE